MEQFCCQVWKVTHDKHKDGFNHYKKRTKKKLRKKSHASSPNHDININIIYLKFIITFVPTMPYITFIANMILIVLSQNKLQSWVWNCHISEEKDWHNTPFSSYVLSCQAFDLEWGWRWPCFDRDQFLVSMITK